MTSAVKKIDQKSGESHATIHWLCTDFYLTKTWPQQSKKTTKSQGKSSDYTLTVCQLLLDFLFYWGSCRSSGTQNWLFHNQPASIFSWQTNFNVPHHTHLLCLWKWHCSAHAPPWQYTYLKSLCSQHQRWLFFHHRPQQTHILALTPFFLLGTKCVIICHTSQLTRCNQKVFLLDELQFNMHPTGTTACRRKTLKVKLRQKSRIESIP